MYSVLTVTLEKCCYGTKWIRYLCSVPQIIPHPQFIKQQAEKTGTARRPVDGFAPKSTTGKPKTPLEQQMQRARSIQRKTEETQEPPQESPIRSKSDIFNDMLPLAKTRTMDSFEEKPLGKKSRMKDSMFAVVGAS
ncbi:hypothetical protein Y032_0149g2696 [Ancylostoma ceylanicum]|uniref:Uncharacterized protein n=1 Tax=Ancylostoma ceylanicum TaxID=53326 RepID=A0A016T1M3_9BILA|nr:hypothetical protein Y032_0149g2696 [Ancylostoma ceylanicum]